MRARLLLCPQSHVLPMLPGRWCAALCCWGVGVLPVSTRASFSPACPVCIFPPKRSYAGFAVLLAPSASMTSESACHLGAARLFESYGPLARVASPNSRPIRKGGSLDPRQVAYLQGCTDFREGQCPSLRSLVVQISLLRLPERHRIELYALNRAQLSASRVEA